jgi:LPXTG-motif cell wall-anchored protein
VVDRTFAVPVATNGGGTPGCAPIVPFLNGATAGLDLPISKGDTSVRHARFVLGNLTIFPPGVVVPTTTSTTTTTTTTTTTVAPNTTIAPVRATALPRTGSSSSGPLALVGVALVAGGLALVRPGRKRRTERS